VNHNIIPLFALLAIPALAQATPNPWQVGLAGNWSPSTQTTLGGTAGIANITVNQNPRIGVSVLAGYSFLNLGQSDLSATAEYQLPTNFTTYVNASVLGIGGTLPTTNKMTSGALGAQINFHEPFDFGFGVQAKWERLSNSDLNTSTNYVRPWVMGYAGYTFDTGSQVKPFVALRGSAAVTKTNAPNAVDFLSDSSSSLRQWLRAADANYQLSLAAGVRF
jgi:hypothetical protein